LGCTSPSGVKRAREYQTLGGDLYQHNNNTNTNTNTNNDERLNAGNYRDDEDYEIEGGADAYNTANNTFKRSYSINSYRNTSNNTNNHNAFKRCNSHNDGGSTAINQNASNGVDLWGLNAIAAAALVLDETESEHSSVTTLYEVIANEIMEIFCFFCIFVLL
jgi:hypothetical protein